ncbi:oxidoreductase-like domain-containing protein 1 [Acyrthosiphon pisum]|uniref:Oxidoreductase-like domain-containing protein n=1 Tax=Acyrthosiphon pisum TaxID=7029 RepID=A0A8R2F8K8_ACYPI|nr:oxidoreductase-like domain-containing protein 1 [Acyrthosiphon pisum]XP_029344425.1 oxidoreductase-like domain-containing protein 1 [Acyrthosiphon pisum]|eukprot:XP_008183487.1 PREDICTED: oxidoreductase-like domain-containing protein 1 [Acyrthosiphon pisum]
MFLISQRWLVNSNRVVCRRKFCSKQPPELPEEPTTCCMSGCANCVWIEYADKVRSMLANSDSKQVSQMVLDKIQDPNMKAFLSMELKSKGL